MPVATKKKTERPTLHIINGEIVNLDEVLAYDAAAEGELTLEEGDDPKPADDKQQLRDDQLAGKRDGIAETYLDWIAAMLSSQLPRAKSMAKAKELMMEFYGELAAFDANPDAAMSNTKPGVAAAEADIRKMAAECKLPAEALGRHTIRSIAEQVVRGDSDAGRRYVADLAGILRRSGHRVVDPPRSVDEMLREYGVGEQKSVAKTPYDEAIAELRS